MLILGAQVENAIPPHIRFAHGSTKNPLDDEHRFLLGIYNCSSSDIYVGEIHFKAL